MAVYNDSNIEDNGTEEAINMWVALVGGFGSSKYYCHTMQPVEAEVLKLL